ncbi:MAG: TIGR04086 family membrane protein [Firmicutes bacterium]|jgi:putative membrane protein (TIGR04086 family)|nr:TIGR04086 family membrane protein [Bacillota bacterium]NLL87463.1 TIGR04086 family membrane protein [Bacillota bacterium]HKM18279.1 TIGR04086 family membrane protein [Limnochordia bacterium]
MKSAAGRINFLLLIQGVAFSCLSMVVLALIMALFTYVSPWQYTDPVLRIANYISILAGSVYVGTKLKQRLWFHGMLLGVIFLVIMTLLRADLKLILQWFWLKQLVIVSVIGVLGSLCGGILQR